MKNTLVLFFLILISFTSLSQNKETRFQRLLTEVNKDLANNEDAIENAISIINRIKNEQGIIVLSSGDWVKFHVPELNRLNKKLKESKSDKETKELKEAIDFIEKHEISYSDFKTKYLKNEKK